MRRLWKGLALWNEEIEQGEEGGEAESERRKAAQRQQATRADRRRFREEFANSSPKQN